jgi:hypothetical protein
VGAPVDCRGHVCASAGLDWASLLTASKTEVRHVPGLSSTTMSGCRVPSALAATSALAKPSGFWLAQLTTSVFHVCDHASAIVFAEPHEVVTIRSAKQSCSCALGRRCICDSQMRPMTASAFMNVSESRVARTRAK